MFFGLAGCFSKKDMTPEAVAQSYLEKKYKQSFTVQNMKALASNDPLLGKTYSGKAFRADLPGYTFSVTVSSDFKTVKDSYYYIQMLPYLDQWMEKKAKELWSEARVVCDATALRYQEDPQYKTGDISAFLTGEIFISTVYLYLPEDIDRHLLPSQLKKFTTSIEAAGESTIEICIVDSQALSLDSLRGFSALPTWKIYSFDSLQVIENRLK